MVESRVYVRQFRDCRVEIHVQNITSFLKREESLKIGYRIQRKHKRDACVFGKTKHAKLSQDDYYEKQGQESIKGG